MCTAITLQSMQGENFFGRTMDFSYPIEPGLFVIPKNYQWFNLSTMKKIYKIPIALSALDKKPTECWAFLDGVNERGFAAVSLIF